MAFSRLVLFLCSLVFGVSALGKAEEFKLRSGFIIDDAIYFQTDRGLLLARLCHGLPRQSYDFKLQHSERVFDNKKDPLLSMRGETKECSRMRDALKSAALQSKSDTPWTLVLDGEKLQLIGKTETQQFSRSSKLFH